jgi:endo-1,4-beta-xylanase
MRLLDTRAGSSRALVLVLVLMVAGGCGGASSSSSAGNSPQPSSAASVPSPTASPAPPLKDLAGSRQFGTAVALPQLDTDARYEAIVAREFNAITPENAMKWGPLEPVRGTLNWGPADEIVAYAQAHGQKIHGHTLVWHNQLPGWLEGGNFSAAELNDILRNHITTEVGRYAGKIYAWDVVNEPFGDLSGWRDTIWLKTLGKGYIANALRWAHAADPAAKLYINDFNIEGTNPKSDAMYDLVKSLKAQGVPLDGVGFQAHFDGRYSFPPMAANLRRFTELGLEVAITELDVRVPFPASQTDLTVQARHYGQAVHQCLVNPGCVGVTVWGFGDAYSWVPSVFPGMGQACLYDADLVPKPAYATVVETLRTGVPWPGY